MSKAPKQRKVQLHYQPYQQSGSNASDGGNGNGNGNGNGSGLLGGGTATAGGAMDYGLHDIMDPVLTGYSSNLSRNLWDDWNENDPSLMKFDMFADDSMGAHAAPAHTGGAVPSAASTSGGLGFMATMLAPHQTHATQQQQPQQQQQQQQQQQHSHSNDTMELDGLRHHHPHQTSNGFHSLLSQPRLSVKRSLSEDLVSMLDEDDGQDPFVTSNGAINKQLLPPSFGFPQHNNHLTNSHASPMSALGTKAQQQPQQFHQQQQQQQLHQQLPDHRPHTPQTSQQSQQPQPQQLLVQHATDWLNGFPADGSPSQPRSFQQQQQPSSKPPLSPASAARLDAHQQRPDPSPMARATAAIASTLVAVPNPCKESAPPETSTSMTPVMAPNAITPSPFSAYSFMSAAAQAAMDSSKSGEGTGEADSKANVANNPFAAANAGGGMMMPGFMMYSMPMMGNYQAAAAAAAAMGMMPMGAMQMGPMGMPMGAMQMNPMGMQMGAMGGMPMGAMGGMQMGMPMMQMAASLGMPVPAAGLGGTPLAAVDGSAAMAGGDASIKMAPKVLQPKAAGGGSASVLAPAGGGAGAAANNASFVSIARKPEEPEVSNILKSLMEEEAKKKEKKLERNRDSARESRKKQQTYVETLENGIKRLQINRDLVVSYRWGITGGPRANAFEWQERVDIVTGKSESFSTLQNPTNFQNLMRINRQRRALSLARDEKQRAIVKCFVCIGKQLAGLRARLLELQVFRHVNNPASAAGHELAEVLRLSEDQKLQLECHSSRVFAQEVLAMVKLFKVFFALRDQALRLNLLSPELERFVRDVCSMEQLQKLLQWTELHRATIDGSSGAHALTLVAAASP